MASMTFTDALMQAKRASQLRAQPFTTTDTSNLQSAYMSGAAERAAGGRQFALAEKTLQGQKRNFAATLAQEKELAGTALTQAKGLSEASITSNTALSDATNATNTSISNNTIAANKKIFDEGVIAKQQEQQREIDANAIIEGNRATAAREAQQREIAANAIIEGNRATAAREAQIAQLTQEKELTGLSNDQARQIATEQIDAQEKAGNNALIGNVVSTGATVGGAAYLMGPTAPAVNPAAAPILKDMAGAANGLEVVAPELVAPGTVGAGGDFALETGMLVDQSAEVGAGITPQANAAYEAAYEAGIEQGLSESAAAAQGEAAASQSMGALVGRVGGVLAIIAAGNAARDAWGGTSKNYTDRTASEKVFSDPGIGFGAAVSELVGDEFARIPNQFGKNFDRFAGNPISKAFKGDFAGGWNELVDAPNSTFQDIGVDRNTSETINKIINPAAAVKAILDTWLCTATDKHAGTTVEQKKAMKKLRRFAHRNHKADLNVYFVDGPKIVDGIETAEKDLKAFYAKLRDSLVVPVVELVTAGQMEEAFDLYKQITVDLCRKYAPEINTEVKEVY